MKNIAALFAALLIPLAAFAQSDDPGSALVRSLHGAWLPLENGLAVSAAEGIPLSAKYEIDDDVFQLSVYTQKGEAFAEVIVDYNTALISRVDVIADGTDLAAARAQQSVMAGARRSLADATAAAVRAHPGYRALSVMPALEAGRPIAHVTLVSANDRKIVIERLD